MQQNYINHIALVLDASSSMVLHTEALIKVVDGQIAHLAKRSQELDQETRVTVYTFANTVECLIYDKDVLRLPSIRGFYRTNGMTALIDATLRSQEDLRQTATLYGDHAFLTYVLTDGEENASTYKPVKLMGMLSSLPDNWTVAVLVPNQQGKFEAKKFGFPADNIAVWDASTAAGISEAGESIRQATDAFMQNRTSGVRGSRNIFSTGAAALNKDTVAAAKLQQLPKNAYRLLDVDVPWPIREWVEKQGYVYQLGTAFYQLTKTELVQARKNIAVRNKVSGAVYTGDSARGVVGLPDVELRVRPEFNPEFDVFVQSTSVNRKLVPGTKLLLLK